MPRQTGEQGQVPEDEVFPARIISDRVKTGRDRPYRVNDRRARRAADAALADAVATADPIEGRALEQLAARLRTLSAGVESRQPWSRR